MQSSTVTAIVVAALSLGLASAAVHAETNGTGAQVPHALMDLSAQLPAPQAPTGMRTVYVGADLDGDGQPDIADPTGKGPRGEDAYGEGRFHARRDGGEREHEGVDYVSTPGQAVEVGHAIGHAHSLQRRYRAITDHVHLELADRRGKKLDAEKLILAKNAVFPAASAMGD